MSSPRHRILITPVCCAAAADARGSSHNPRFTKTVRTPFPLAADRHSKLNTPSPVGSRRRGRITPCPSIPRLHGRPLPPVYMSTSLRPALSGPATPPSYPHYDLNPLPSPCDARTVSQRPTGFGTIREAGRVGWRNVCAMGREGGGGGSADFRSPT